MNLLCIGVPASEQIPPCFLIPTELTSSSLLLLEEPAAQDGKRRFRAPPPPPADDGGSSDCCISTARLFPREAGAGAGAALREELVLLPRADVFVAFALEADDEAALHEEK